MFNLIAIVVVCAFVLFITFGAVSQIKKNISEEKEKKAIEDLMETRKQLFQMLCGFASHDLVMRGDEVMLAGSLIKVATIVNDQLYVTYRSKIWF